MNLRPIPTNSPNASGRCAFTRVPDGTDVDFGELTKVGMKLVASDRSEERWSRTESILGPGIAVRCHVDCRTSFGFTSGCGSSNVCPWRVAWSSLVSTKTTMAPGGESLVHLGAERLELLQSDLLSQPYLGRSKFVGRTGSVHRITARSLGPLKTSTETRRP